MSPRKEFGGLHLLNLVQYREGGHRSLAGGGVRNKIVIPVHHDHPQLLIEYAGLLRWRYDERLMIPQVVRSSFLGLEEWRLAFHFLHGTFGVGHLREQLPRLVPLS